MTADRAARAHPAATTLTARSPEDVLALVPVVLGFEPAESMVMLTFGSDPPFHARVNLPAQATDIEAMAASLVEPATLHKAPRALLVAYSERARLAEQALRRTARALRSAGVEVIDGLRTDGHRWHPVPRRAGVPPSGVPYDLSAHPFAAQAVFDGRVLHRSREDLAASIAAEPGRVERVVAALAALTGEPAPALEEGQWVHDLVVRQAAAMAAPTDAEVARLVRGLLDVRVRDAAWSPLRRAVADQHVEFWSDVVRRTPELMLPAPAALLAFAAWHSGQGALAWCAVDRCLEVDEHYTLGQLVAELLTRAVAPDSWQGGFDWTLGMGMSPKGAG